MSTYRIESSEKLYWDDTRKLLAEKTSLPDITLKKIMHAYVDTALEELNTHYTFRFSHIAIIYAQDTDYIEEPYTMAYTALRVSNITEVPYNTVLGVLKALVELVEINLRQGKNFNLIRLISFKSSTVKGTDQIKVYATLSKYIYNALENVPYRLRTQVLASFRHTI